MEDLKILAIVKMNDYHAYVFNREFNTHSIKLDADTIVTVGEDNNIFRSYVRVFDTHSKAFSGREFNITLADGTVEKCKGQWWDRENKTSKEFIKAHTCDEGLCDLTHNTMDGLIKRGYVYYGGFIANKSFMRKLISEYEGKIYEYREYEKDVILPIIRKQSDIHKRNVYMDIIESGCRSKGKWLFEYPDNKRLLLTDAGWWYTQVEEPNERISAEDIAFIKSVFGDNLKGFGFANHTPHLIVEVKGMRRFLFYRV